MKIRIRSLETKETMRLEISDTCSFSDLKTLIAAKLSSTSNGVAPESIRLSLNSKDELSCDSPSASLRSIGITSGDLIFFSIDPTPVFGPSIPISSDEKLDAPAPNLSPVRESLNSEKKLEEAPNQGKTLTLDFQEGTSHDPDGDDMEEDVEPLLSAKSSSVPCLLKRVFDSEKEEAKGNLGLVVIAVHAVFLESGFVVLDGSGLKLPGGWATAVGALSVCYTVPQLIDSDSKDAKVAVLKFCMMGNHVSIYGFLTGGTSGVHRACLDVSKLLPLWNLPLETMSEMEEKEVFKFWKVVKDGLTLPLLIDVCDKNGLPPPPCLACLPTDLKIRILELLPGVDVARAGCANSEMHYLASNDELWKQKYFEEFGLVYETGAAVNHWKARFARQWMKKKKNLSRNRWERVPERYLWPLRRYIPYGLPPFHIIGGEHDITGVGGFGLVGPRSGFFSSHRRNFSPGCDLGQRDVGFRY
ncbi:hypothetical protein J5N97_024628 [Dioscorea zingiberensis]|uniref:Ubiquitin-like domain-containing protein n=1 Tax=Dioscorea zingiberensis TaxID=325984 RepID=A0A9D5H8V7_9LILI|nr:hypothetical protein J5N97_024628 [Dioscorea zingiberensis]